MLRNDLFRPWFVGEKDWGFEIIDGEFKDVAVQIEKLEFPEDGSSQLNLDYHVVHKPELITEQDLQGDGFKAVVEVIINDILKEAIDHFEQTRNDDPEESSSR